MRLLLRSHAIRLALIRVIQPRLLCHLAPGFDQFDLPLDLVRQRLANEPEGIYVLYFRLGSELLLPAWPHTGIRIAAQRAFLHVAIAHSGVKNDLLQPREIFVSFVGRRDIWFADNLNQRYSAAVEIDSGLLRGVRKSFMQALARILLQMEACNANFLRSALAVDLNPPMFGQRPVVLRNLISLGQVRVEVILPRKDRSLIYAGIQGHRGQHRKFHRLAIQHGQRPR